MDTKLNGQERTTWLLDHLLLICVFVLLYGALCYFRPMGLPDFAETLSMSKQMLGQNQFLIPSFDPTTNHVAPPLVYWLQTVSLLLSGGSNFALRLWALIFAIVGILGDYCMMRTISNRRTGIIAGFLTGSNLIYFLFAQAIGPVMIGTVLVSLALLCFSNGIVLRDSQQHRRYLWLFWLYTSLAALALGLAGLILPLFIVLTWLVI